MRNRVLYRDNKNYSGRGITICKEWASYDIFFSDMGERPEGMTLDRVDGDGDYYKTNCRWATISTQLNNTIRNIHIRNGYEVKTISQWSDDLLLTKTQRNRVYKRHQYGATTFEELFTDAHLLTYRRSLIENQCVECGSVKSCKWRESGKRCNTCWCREYRKLCKAEKK